APPAGRNGPLTDSAQVKLDVVNFVPKTISGTIFVDSNSNGALNASEKVLSGVTVELRGCDFTSSANCNPATNVIQTTTTDASGKYTFSGTGGIGVAPPKEGTSYTVTEVQPLFLL